nr:uncharacterized protein c1f12.04c [Quercus suber]
MVEHSLSAIRKALLGASSKHILHLHRVTSSTAGLDSTLCLVSYTLTLLHAQLTRLLSAQYTRLALELATKTAPSLLDGETVFAQLTAPRTRLSEASLAVKNLADVIADVRIFLRLKGLLGIYAWGLDAYAHPSRDPTVKLLVWAQVGVNAAFQALENTAYLVSKGVIPGQAWKEREAKLWAWSCRFWFAHVVLECVRLLRVRGMGWREELGAQSAGDADKDEVRVRSKELETRWRREFYTNAAWFPLTLHWSFEDPANSPIKEKSTIGIFGMMAGWSGFSNAWVATA